MTRRCRGRTISRKNPVHVLLAIENILRLLWGRGGMESQAHSFRCDFQPTVTGLYYLYLIFNFLFTMLAIVLRRYKLCEFQRSVLTSKSAPLLPPPPPPSSISTDAELNEKHSGCKETQGQHFSSIDLRFLKYSSVSVQDINVIQFENYNRTLQVVIQPYSLGNENLLKVLNITLKR